MNINPYDVQKLSANIHEKRFFELVNLLMARNIFVIVVLVLI